MLVRIHLVLEETLDRGKGGGKAYGYLGIAAPYYFAACCYHS